MAIPTEKSVAIEQYLQTINPFRRNRKESIQNNICWFCGGPAVGFKDELSVKEYTISGLCQVCQNETFGE